MFKKILTLVLALTLSISIFTFVGCGNDGGDDEPTAITLENGLTVENGVVTAYTPTADSDVVLEIPEKVGDMYVTEIAGEVFRNCKAIKRLKMPKTISKVGKLAFNGCSNLEIVECQSVASWCGITFNDVYSNPMTQSKTKQLYVDGAALTELVIPETVYSIGQYAFYTLSGLTRVVVGSNVAFIGKSALFVANGMALDEFKFMNTKGWVNAGTGGKISSSFKPVHKGQSNASHAYTFAWPAYTTWGLNADWKRVE